MRARDDQPFLSPAIIDTTAMADRPDVELFGPILQVIRIDEGGIAEITFFLDTARLFPLFGLPPRLDP